MHNRKIYSFTKLSKKPMLFIKHKNYPTWFQRALRTNCPLNWTPTNCS